MSYYLKDTNRPYTKSSYTPNTTQNQNTLDDSNLIQDIPGILPNII